MRITFAVTMALFLAPVVYVVKYYARDRPREETIAKQQFFPEFGGLQTNPDYLLRTSRRAKDAGLMTGSRQRAVLEIGHILRQSGVNYKRPIECLSAKATLADLAAKDPDPNVRATASSELGKVAANGAVLRR